MVFSLICCRLPRKFHRDLLKRYSNLIVLTFSTFLLFSVFSTIGDVPLLKLFNLREMWRTEILVYCLLVTGLSLSLPELMASAVTTVVGVASHVCVIPVLFARESILTSTHLHAIVLISKWIGLKRTGLSPKFNIEFEDCEADLNSTHIKTQVFTQN